MPHQGCGAVPVTHAYQSSRAFEDGNPVILGEPFPRGVIPPPRQLLFRVVPGGGVVVVVGSGGLGGRVVVVVAGLVLIDLRK